jgi:hypothetical protein
MLSRKTLKTREKKNLLPARQKCVCADCQSYQNVSRETFWYDPLELQVMNVLLLGSGGREHSIAIALAKSPLLETLFVVPGNPGMAEIGENTTRRKSPT